MINPSHDPKTVFENEVRVELKLTDTYGKELQRSTRFSNPHHFNLRCYKSNIIPSSLWMKPPVNTDRARAAVAHASRVFVQERIRSSWKIKTSASSQAQTYCQQMKDTIEEEDFTRVVDICKRTAEKTFTKFKNRQQRSA